MATELCVRYIEDVTKFTVEQELLTLLGGPEFTPGVKWGYRNSNFRFRSDVL
jgi:hypothetical protein